MLWLLRSVLFFECICATAFKMRPSCWLLLRALGRPRCLRGSDAGSDGTNFKSSADRSWGKADIALHLCCTVEHASVLLGLSARRPSRVIHGNWTLGSHLQSPNLDFTGTPQAGFCWIRCSGSRGGGGTNAHALDDWNHWNGSVHLRGL